MADDQLDNNSITPEKTTSRLHQSWDSSGDARIRIDDLVTTSAHAFTIRPQQGAHDEMVIVVQRCSQQRRPKCLTFRSVSSTFRGVVEYSTLKSLFEYPTILTIPAVLCTATELQHLFPRVLAHTHNSHDRSMKWLATSERLCIFCFCLRHHFSLVHCFTNPKSRINIFEELAFIIQAALCDCYTHFPGRISSSR